MPRFSSLQATTNRFAIPRTLMAGFVVAALATLIIALVNFVSSETRTEAVDAMDRTALSIRELNMLNASIKDAESGQRGYLLTGDSSYLQPYQTALTAISRQVAALKASTQGDTIQNALAVQIDDVAKQRLSDLDKGVTLRRAGMIPFAWIADLSRQGYYTNTFDDASDFVRSMAGHYRADLWRDADCRCEVWAESRSIASVMLADCKE